jgi:catechol 2,3-dioxygenase
MPRATAIGHVHPHVGLGRGGGLDALGFDRMTWHYPGALFLGAGGFHHHVRRIALAGSAVTQAPEDQARLPEWAIEVPDAPDLTDAVNSLSDANTW